MGVIANYSWMERGNTVPYPPLNDEIRENSGFTDLRGRPDLAVSIPEAIRSSALSNLLQHLAVPNSKIMTLGCDLGEHEELHDDQKRRVAGGYLQITSSPIFENCRDELFAICKSVEGVVSEEASAFDCRLEFALCRTNFVFDALIEGLSVWLWFFAIGKTYKEARASREKLVISIGTGLCLAAGVTTSKQAISLVLGVR